MTSHDETAIKRTDLPADTSTATTAEPSTADVSGAVARLLEVAAHNADQLLAEATAEADHLVAAARDQADQVLSAARTEARQVRADLEETQAHLNSEVARLQQLEHDHRDRMRNLLTDMLAQVETDQPT